MIKKRFGLVLLVCVPIVLMAFKPSQLDMIGKYESVCMEKQQDLLKRYVFFRKLDLRQDTTFHMSSRDASFHGSRYGRWQIKRKYLILREIVPVDRLADSCAFGQEHSYEWVYWIKNRDTLIQVDGRRPRVPIDTLVRISDEKYYKENKALSWDDSFERTQCLPSWRQEN